VAFARRRLYIDDTVALRRCVVYSVSLVHLF